MSLHFATLTGGRAPARQLQLLARATARLTFGRRASGWINEFSQVQPKLLSNPLYGNCLAELAARVLADVEQEPEQRASKQNRTERHATAQQPSTTNRCITPARQNRRVPSSELDGRPPRRPTSIAARQTGREEPLLKQMPHRVDLGRLQLLSGESEIRANRPVVRDLPAQSLQGLEAPELPLGPRDPQVTKQLFAELALRAGRQFQRPSPTARSIADQSSIPLIGGVAPADLLARLATSSTSFERGSDRAPEAPVSDSLPTDTIGSSSVGTETVLADNEITGYSSPKSARATGWSTWMPETPLSPDVITLPLAERAAAATTGTLPDLAAEITAARRRSILPPLLPQKGPTVPIPPAAGAMTRQGAREEVTVTGEEDLSNLSAKIARILGEEARRHGIDV